MRYLYAAIAALCLASCATPTQPLEAQGRGRVVIGAATLASLGTIEWHAAPSYTKLALLRQRAARRLNDGRISVETARHVQATADKARGSLDHALEVHGKSEALTKVAESELERAQRLIAEAEKQLLEESKR